ncbi:hypothetical protein I7I51_02952 [Histoplasma capsulatum]|uniref:Uncharacterized protein n=1 Tax=Ajellomyces capsulatus TaxID=5037 RepID=A0A8A1MQ71_AJECA|nr:predicted protein [Histoplasma mississippiense (nom. inval.)]EDN11348.1 predicted protein [Histoplasma mississippiense (nom. inval.)]QSS66743.1 hypothetical protein I7I51_02952 [Histoplasma capsulatum]
MTVLHAPHCGQLAMSDAQLGDRKTLCPVITKQSILFVNESDVFERGESLAMDLLLGCVREMHSLDEVIWASNPVPPGHLMEAFAAQNITAFTCDGDPRVTKLSCPLDVLKLDLLSQCPLRSLSIKASTEPELLGLRDAIFTHRKSLESLALRFGDWATWHGYLVFRTGYPDCAPKSVLEGEGDPTFVLFEPFVQASEKLCLQSFDLLVDVGCLKHLQISRRHIYRTVQGTLLGEWQDYHSLESLAFEGKPLPNRAGSQDSQDSWDEIAARLTSLSVDQFIPHLGRNFSSLRMLAMTMPLSPSHLPIPELKAVCPLLEQLAYVQPPGLFTRDLPDLEGMPHLRRIYAMVNLKSSIVMDYFARFMEYCCKTESPLLDRLDRFAGGVTVCDIVSVRQLEWSLRLPLNVQEAEAEAVHENENAGTEPLYPPVAQG